MLSRKIRCLLVFVLMVVLCNVFVYKSAFGLTDEGYKNLHVFSEILRQVEQYYVDPVDDKQMIRGAVKGMLNTLDPHTVFMPPEIYKELKVESSGRFGGVGLEITVKKGWLTVVAPVEGTPAARAGIKPNDRIVKIDGTPTKDMDVVDAVSKMRGREGSYLTLTILRDDGKKPIEVRIKREVIKVPSIHAELLPDGYGYARIVSFQERTSKDLQTALSDMEKSGPLKGLVLDMRNNPGGLLDEAVLVSDLFLKSGVIVSTVSRNKEIDRRDAHPEGTVAEYPIVIIVNGGSASAAEIVAGALQDHHRALLIGTQTFGKGSVQSVVELDDGSALKLTVARYYTPSGRSIQVSGIWPDIIVEETPRVTAEASAEKSTEGSAEKVVEEGGKKARFREATLPGHLKGAEVAGKKMSTLKPPTVTIPEGAGAEKFDYQKAVAVEILRNWQKYGKAL